MLPKQKTTSTRKNRIPYSIHAHLPLENQYTMGGDKILQIFKTFSGSYRGVLADPQEEKAAVGRSDGVEEGAVQDHLPPVLGEGGTAIADLGKGCGRHAFFVHGHSGLLLDAADPGSLVGDGGEVGVGLESVMKIIALKKVL